MSDRNRDRICNLVLRYLKGMKYLILTLSADALDIIQWWVDASYATHDHEDCRGHTGAMMSLGQGAGVSFSCKHKINARSSTEAELIGMSMMPYLASSTCSTSS
jgi:hypothetical protein